MRVPYSIPSAPLSAIEAVRIAMERGEYFHGPCTEAIESYYLASGFHGVFVNSGSSAVDLMVRCIADEDCTVAVPSVGFPTTYAPLVKMGIELVPMAWREALPFVSKPVDEPVSLVMESFLLGFPNDLDQHYTTMLDLCDCLPPSVEFLYANPKLTAFTLSFHPAHQLNGGGGGVVYFRCRKRAERARAMASWGRACRSTRCMMGRGALCREHRCTGERRYGITEWGGNLLGCELNAVIAWDSWQSAAIIRERRCDIYDEIWSDAFGDDLHIPSFHCHVGWSPFGIPIRSTRPYQFRKFLADRGIEYRVPFTTLRRLQQQAYDNDLTLPDTCGKVAEPADWDNWLFIGCHHNYTDEQVQYVRAALGEWRDMTATGGTDADSR